MGMTGPNRIGSELIYLPPHTPLLGQADQAAISMPQSEHEGATLSKRHAVKILRRLMSDGRLGADREIAARLVAIGCAYATAKADERAAVNATLAHAGLADLALRILVDDDEVTVAGLALSG